MMQAIMQLRKIADEVEAEARTATPAVRAELMDCAAKWHWLASEAGKLCVRARQSSNFTTDCAECPERCSTGRRAAPALADGMVR